MDILWYCAASQDCIMCASASPQPLYPVFFLSPLDKQQGGRSSWLQEFIIEETSINETHLFLANASNTSFRNTAGNLEPRVRMAGFTQNFHSLQIAACGTDLYRFTLTKG